MKLELDNILQDYIQGEKFVSLYNYDGVYYRDTHKVNEFFADPPPRPFILISHNSDGKITDTPGKFDADVNLMPDNLIRWYGQNVDVYNDRIESIPIGLENSHWFKKEKKIFKLKSIIKTEKQIKNLVYLNVNISSKHNGFERQSIYNMLQHKAYVTTEYGKNGVSFDNYLTNLYNHYFMVCPEGNGIDVHQPWESMYINTIPIQKKNKNNGNWRELPVCWLDDWEQMEDEAFLLSEYNRISSSPHDTRKLRFSYWKNKILDAI